MLKRENFLLEEFNIPDFVPFLTLQHSDDETFNLKVRTLYEHPEYETILCHSVPNTPNCPLKGFHFEGFFSYSFGFKLKLLIDYDPPRDVESDLIFPKVRIYDLHESEKSPKSIVTFLKQYGHEKLIDRLTFMLTNRHGEKENVTAAQRACPLGFKPQGDIRSFDMIYLRFFR